MFELKQFNVSNELQSRGSALSAVSNENDFQNKVKELTEILSIIKENSNDI